MGFTTVRTLAQRCQMANESGHPFFACYKDHCLYLPPMLGWFFFSGCLSLYNKYVFGKEHMAFPCPLLMTSVHFLSQWIFAFALTSLFPVALGGDHVKGMSWAVFLAIAIPCGFVTSADVGFSNLALVRISITFYTMVKSSAPIFVVLSAYCFGIEQITRTLLLVVFIISAGELLTVLGEVQFDTIGFILCLIASILSGMRWTIVQLKLQSLDPPLKSTLATMRVLSPLMFISMLSLSFIFEQPITKFSPNHNDGSSGDGGGNNENYKYFATFPDAMWTLGIAMVGASLAICMIMCEFYLIMRTSAIVLMIGGVCKELTTIILGVTVFHDELNAINITGCFVVFSGVILFKISLHLSKLEKSYDSVNEKIVPKDSGNTDDDDDDDDEGGIGGNGVGLKDIIKNGYFTDENDNYNKEGDDDKDIFVIMDDEVDDEEHPSWQSNDVKNANNEII